MIPLYHETPALRATVERLLGDAPLAPTDSRHRFGKLIADADAGIICLRGCTAADLKWLLTVASPGVLAPPCIVITPLSIGSLQRLRGIEASRLHVVWTEEVDDRLVDVLAEIEPWYDDPLRLLGPSNCLAAARPTGRLSRRQALCKPLRRPLSSASRDDGHRAGIRGSGVRQTPSAATGERACPSPAAPSCC